MIPANSIGTLNEKPLHAALKQWYAQPGDRFEARVGNFIVDILRDDLIIEIQTGSFGSICIPGRSCRCITGPLTGAFYHGGSGQPSW